MTETPALDDWDEPQAAERLGVKCTDSDCENDLHCFKQTRRMALDGAPRGTCRACNQQLVELDRTRRRDINDRDYLLSAFRKELIRHHFWHLPIDQRALDHAVRKGRKGLNAAASKRLQSSVGRAKPFRDGTQTPMRGNSIYYAQHATASCCRTCIEYWHGIPKGHELKPEEIAFLLDLVVGYLDDRLPELPDEAGKVARRAGS